MTANAAIPAVPLPFGATDDSCGSGESVALAGKDGGGTMHVEFMHPGSMGELSSSVPVAELAREVRGKLRRVMNAH